MKNNNLFKYVDNIITWTDGYYGQFSDDKGKIIYSESSISDLNKIIKEIVKLHNYVIENELYAGNNEIYSTLSNIQEYLDKIEITEQNAKKLDLKKALNYWENIHTYGFKLAFDIAQLEKYYEEK